MTRHVVLSAVMLLLACEAAASGEVVKNPQASLLMGVAFDQNLNAQLPLETPLRDETGRDVILGEYFNKGKPVVLLFVYYECPMLCTLELNGLVRNLRVLSMSAGKEFEIVTVSIDPKDTPNLARVKKTGYLKRYDRAGVERGWHFLTGDEPAIRRLTGAAGFKYALDPKSGQYAHPAGLVITTPGGRIARYIYGVDFPASNLRWGLVEASNGKIGSPVDKVLLMCFHYDPTTGRYNVAVMSAVRVLGVATFGCLGTFMLVMFRRERRQSGGVPVGSAIVDHE